MLISKFITWKQLITINILPKILRSQGNQTIKLGQFIEYNIRNIFPRNYTQNMTEKLVPGFFLKH